MSSQQEKLDSHRVGFGRNLEILKNICECEKYAVLYSSISMFLKMINGVFLQHIIIILAI